MTTYTVTERNGCRLISGALPADAFLALSQGMPKNAVMDPHAARLLGVTFAMGSPASLKALTAAPDVVAAARQRAELLGPHLSAPAMEWLALGFHGISSMTMFQRLTGVHLTDCESHPSDPGALGRCRLLLEQVPDLRPRLAEMTDPNARQTPSK
jgi:hypothetical protein